MRSASRRLARSGVGCGPLFFVARTDFDRGMTASDSPVVAKSRAIAERVAASLGLEVVDVEWHGATRRGVLRIFIDKPGGVTLDDCEKVSRQVSTILDVEDIVPGAAYHLEVSSPGLDRKLTKPSDFERFAGRKAKVRLKVPLDGRQQFTGTLAGFEEGRVLLAVDGGETLRLQPDELQSARLVIELGAELKER